LFLIDKSRQQKLPTRGTARSESVCYRVTGWESSLTDSEAGRKEEWESAL